ncbi:hypothetical protein lerEdw1_018702 [Lerista edwardsae]|nr:hypothetical protein lerEdw1_018702 [Lerista edwardsae]
MAMTLVYWDIRGLAHAIRLLLEFTETPYEDKQYSSGEGCDFDKTQWNFIKQRLGLDPPSTCSSHGTTGWTQWTNEKNKLGLDFPNLPYLIDGDTKITHSNAILRYLARKHKMCGESEEELIRIDMLENQVMDFRLGLARICYSPDFEKLKPDYLEQLPGKLKLFSQFLGDRKWFAGKKITFVDFLAYDILDVHRMLEPKCLDQFTNLKDFLDRFELAHSIRLLLEYTGTPYEDKLYSCGEAPDYDKSQWISEKEKLGLDFPNVCSNVFLLSPTPIRTETMFLLGRGQVCLDFSLEHPQMVFLYSNDLQEKLKPGYLEQLPGKLKLFSQFLGDRKWFAGDKITFVDFLVYDVLDQNRMFEPKCLDEFKNLQDFLAHFEALEKIAAYMRSSRFMKTPINNRMAKWGNKKE